MYANQVVRGVDVFLPSQAIVGDTVPLGHTSCLTFLNSRVQPLHNHRPLVGCWSLLFLLRWHFTRADPLHDFGPEWRILKANFLAQGVEAEIPLLLLVVVTFEAVDLKKGLEILLE